MQTVQKLVRQGGLSRGFEQHAASLRNGLRMQAQTRPARVTPLGQFYVSPIMQEIPCLTTLSTPYRSLIH